MIHACICDTHGHPERYTSVVTRTICTLTIYHVASAFIVVGVKIYAGPRGSTFCHPAVYIVAEREKKKKREREREREK